MVAWYCFEAKKGDEIELYNLLHPEPWMVKEFVALILLLLFSQFCVGYSTYVTTMC